MAHAVLDTIVDLNKQGSPACWSSRTSRRRWSWRAGLCAGERRDHAFGSGADLLADDRVRQAYLGM